MTTVITLGHDQDEREWAALEALRDATWVRRRDGSVKPVECAPPFRNRPHPDSYRPDIPLHAPTFTQLTTTTLADRRQYALAPLTVRQESENELAVAILTYGLTARARSMKWRRSDSKQAAKEVAAMQKSRANLRKRATELSLNFTTVPARA